MKRIGIITGANGLLGATLMREFALRGLTPLALSSDVRDKVAVAKEITEANPEWVIHAAAMTGVADCEKNPAQAYEVNARGTAHVAGAAKASGARLVYISTASVFKGDKGNYREEETPEATNIYNETKIEGEKAALEYEKAMVLRLNLVGIHPEGSRGKNFAEWLFDSAFSNKDLSLFNDQRINALSNWSVARLLREIISKEIYEPVLHIGTKDALSKAEFAKLFLKHFPSYSGVITERSIDSIADGVVRPKEMWLNTDRAAALLGPMPPTEEEVRAICASAGAF
jgi:dTDP-4-dehydrorhamnose reductase